MDTEKKVQFVALTKEEIDAMIQQAALAGTGRADQIDDLAAIDVERQILEDGAV